VSEAHIRCSGLVRRFGSVVALAGLDLEVAAGDVVALLGPNGAGKSTLLRVLCTAVLPDEGEAWVGDVDVAADPAAARRRIGVMIGDERSLYWRLSGRANLRFFCALHGLARKPAERQAAELLDTVGLSAAADRPVRGYSSGMRARLSLARALIGSPPVLLLDEPTRALDPIAARAFRETITTLARDGGTAILLATHDLQEAVTLADRIVVLSRGSVVYEAGSAGLDATELEEAFVEAVAAHEGESSLGSVA
jgi:ABC-type multidrug transport system ATPase subunit